jgi:hypothetical protein
MNGLPRGTHERAAADCASTPASNRRRLTVCGFRLLPIQTQMSNVRRWAGFWLTGPTVHDP